MPRNPFQRPPVVNRKNSQQTNARFGGDPWQKPKRVKKTPATEKDGTTASPDPSDPDKSG